MRDSLRFKPTAVMDEIEVTKISIENRRQRVSDMCSSQGASYYSGNYSDNDFFHHIYMDEKHKFLYCAIEKVGCTFWKRLLYFLSGEKNLSSPYDLSMSRAHTVPLLNVDKLSKPAYHHVMNTYTKIIFVRDPYKRLFSGYVDKIFSRYDAWSSYSKIIIQLARKNRTYLSNACGNDVTFAEFVTFYTYSMNKKLYMNGHFVPMYVHSRPCDVKYDFIGKLETFKSDVAFIFKKLGLEDIIPLLSAQKSVAATDEFYDATSIIFGAKNKKANCFDFYDFVVRTWRKLQIKGLISTKIPLPFSRREMDSVNKDLFFKTLLKSHEISLRDLDLKNNRVNAIKEAFQSVSSDSIEKLKAILHPDCKLFGYDLEPKYLFQPSKTKPNSFKYFDFNRDINVLNKML